MIQTLRRLKITHFAELFKVSNTTRVGNQYLAETHDGIRGSPARDNCYTPPTYMLLEGSTTQEFVHGRGFSVQRMQAHYQYSVSHFIHARKDIHPCWRWCHYMAGSLDGQQGATRVASPPTMRIVPPCGEKLAARPLAPLAEHQSSWDTARAFKEEEITWQLSLFLLHSCHTLT